MPKGRRGKLPSPLVQPGGRKDHLQGKAWALLWCSIISIHIQPSFHSQNPHKSNPHSSHTHTSSRLMEENHGLPLCRAATSFSRPKVLPSGGQAVACTDFTFIRHRLGPVLHRLLNSGTSYCVRGAEPQCSPSLALSNSSHAWWCEHNPPVQAAGEAQAGLVSTKKQQKGAINKQLWQRKAVLLTIKSVEQLPTRSSVAAKSSV